MNQSLGRWRLLVICLVLLGGVASVYGTNAALSEPANEREGPHRTRYLYVCAGDQARAAPDFLAVVDFDPRSPSYGKVLARAPLPEPGATGNEFHHVGLSADRKVVACGGLLSVLKGQKEVFFFDISEPRTPRFLSSADPPLSAITDEFHALPHGGFLVTMMGGAQGHAPGRVAEFDSGLRLVAEHPAQPPEDGFNPHGISVRPELDLMVTSDFVCPSTTLHAAGADLVFRAGVRVWNLARREIVRSVKFPEGASGTIDVQLIPDDPHRRAFTAGMLDGHLYLVDTRQGTARAVFDFNWIASGSWPQLIRITRDGKRLFISLNQAGKVVMLDISNPEHPRLVDTLDLGKDSGPHYLALTRDEERLVISDYFLNEDAFGKVHAEGDHKIHVANIGKHGLELDRRFSLDFNTAFDSGPARPHGLVAP